MSMLSFKDKIMFKVRAYKTVKNSHCLILSKVYILILDVFSGAIPITVKKHLSEVLAFPSVSHASFMLLILEL